jgi:hypothetical protein
MFFLIEPLLEGGTAAAIQCEKVNGVWKPTTTVVTVSDTLMQSGGINAGLLVQAFMKDDNWEVTNSAGVNMQGVW